MAGRWSWAIRESQLFCYPWRANPTRKRPQVDYWVQIPWRSGQHSLRNSWSGSRQFRIHAAVSGLSFSREGGRGKDYEAQGAYGTQALGLRGWGCPEWVSHLGAGSVASGLGRTLSAPRVPASAWKHLLPGFHTGTFRQPVLCTTSLPFLLRTERRVKHRGPQPVPPPQLPSHALYASSSFQLREGIGQLNWPARAGEGEARLEAYCAGVILSSALRLALTARDLRLRLAARSVAKTAAGGVSKFPRLGSSAFRWVSLESCPRREPCGFSAWRLWPVLPLCQGRELITTPYKAWP